MGGLSHRLELPRGGLSGGQILHVRGGERLATDAPVAATDLLDDAPRH